jgi:hypothetical protein
LNSISQWRKGATWQASRTRTVRLMRASMGQPSQVQILRSESASSTETSAPVTAPTSAPCSRPSSLTKPVSRPTAAPITVPAARKYAR